MQILRLAALCCLVLGLPWPSGVQAADRLLVCLACHDTGAGGAPRRGRAQDWAPRLKKGMPRLIASVRHGVPGTLMPSDTCDDCTDAEIKSLIRRLSAAAAP